MYRTELELAPLVLRLLLLLLFWLCVWSIRKGRTTILSRRQLLATSLGAPPPHRAYCSRNARSRTNISHYRKSFLISFACPTHCERSQLLTLATSHGNENINNDSRPASRLSIGALLGGRGRPRVAVATTGRWPDRISAAAPLAFFNSNSNSWRIPIAIPIPAGAACKRTGPDRTLRNSAGLLSF